VIDWSKIARTVFVCAGDGVWAYGTAGNVLLWIGFWICTPMGALMYLLGSTFGQLFAVFIGLPASYIHYGYGVWGYGLTCYVVSGLLFVPSRRSILIGLGSTMTHTLVTVWLDIVMGTWGLAGGGLAHSLACLSFMGLKNLKTHLVPVDICEMTVAEDHYYQQALGSKLFDDLFTKMREYVQLEVEVAPSVAPGTAEASATIDLSHIEVQAPRPRRSKNSLCARVLACLKDPWPRIANVPCLWRVIDVIWLLLSWGAFTFTELQPDKSELYQAHLNAEVQALTPDWLVDQLEEIYKSLHEVDQKDEKYAFESSVLSVCLLSGFVELSENGLASFKKIMAQIRAHRLTTAQGGGAGTATMAGDFISSMLQLRYQDVDSGAVSTLLDSFGVSAGEDICLVAFRALMVKVRPEDTKIDDYLEEMFNLLDEDHTGAFLHCVLPLPPLLPHTSTATSMNGCCCLLVPCCSSLPSDP
jgi:hypothetical protein